jgi:hypothetical protein
MEFRSQNVKIIVLIIAVAQGGQMLNPEIGKYFSKIGKNREKKSGSFKMGNISKNHSKIDFMHQINLI